MKYENYKLLQDKFDNKDFNKSYKPINLTLYIFSLFGNIASVFFAFFFLYNIMTAAVGSLAAATILAVASVFFLSAFELLKRYVFHRFTLEWVYAKFKLTYKETIILGLFSILLIASSFYMSLNGAHKFSDKSENIAADVDSVYKQYEDTLIKKYSVFTQELKVENQSLSEANVQYNQDAENTRNISIKRQKLELIRVDNQTIKDNKLKIDNYEKELTVKLKEQKYELKLHFGNEKNKNNSSGFKFILLSTFIELIILIGILFNNYYSYRSYKEYVENTASNENFLKWQKYNVFLDIIYKNGKKLLNPGEESISASKVKDLARINGIHTSEKEIADSYKVFNHLHITATRSNRRFVTSDYDLAKDTLRMHFNIK